jgi:hypothetical protein
MPDSPFVFETKDSSLTEREEEDRFVIRVPSGIQSKMALMAAYKEKAKLPSYFGSNWDALDECLRDFSWISEEVIVLAHRDLPLSQSAKESGVYLDLLRETVEFWRQLQNSNPGSSVHGAQSPQHKLIVIFPSSLEDEVAALLNMN